MRALALTCAAALTLGGVVAGVLASPASAATRLQRAARGTLTGTITLKRGRRIKRDQSGVVVYLDAPGVHAPDASSTVHEIRQQDRTFLPEVSVVYRGTTLSFPNDDRIEHNVFSPSDPGDFDLGRYRSGETKTVVVDRVGEVEVFCNIHPDMAAKVLVIDTPYYAVTDRDGNFRIGHVPPGTYDYVVWQPWGKTKQGTLTITANKTTALNLTLKELGKPRHLRKDGTHYGRYQ